MNFKVCLSADTIGYPEGGGNLWAYLNWALGLRALGCEVIWLETMEPETSADDARSLVGVLKSRLERADLAQSLAVCASTGEELAPGVLNGCLDLNAAAEADLLLNMHYELCSEIVKRFRRSALLDIDPGLLQIWMSERQIQVAPHDTYFSIGETVGKPASRIPDVGLDWQYTPPCVALDWWPAWRAPDHAPFTTVAHWYKGWVEYRDESYSNNKRSGFLPFLELPRYTAQPLELALNLEADDEDQLMLKDRGWRICDSYAVASTPWDYQRYIQNSSGEFSCAKPSCIRLQNAWVSDRTLCYLASAKPAVIQHTGPSRFLPDSAGLFRFRDLKEAACYLDMAAADYERQCRLARSLVAEHFDARKVAEKVLERVLP